MWKDSPDNADSVGKDRSSPQAIRSHQQESAAKPGMSIHDLVARAKAENERFGGQVDRSAGNFADLDSLLEQFESAPIIELGKPLPKEKHLPSRRGRRAGQCPATHNRALIGEDLH